MPEDEVDESKIVCDHGALLKEHPNMRIQSITIYGTNFVEAIVTKFVDKKTGVGKEVIAHGTAFLGRYEQQQTIDLSKNEAFDQVTCSFDIETCNIRSLAFNTSLDNCWILEGEVSLPDNSIISEDDDSEKSSNSDSIEEQRLISDQKNSPRKSLNSEVPMKNPFLAKYKDLKVDIAKLSLIESYKNLSPDVKVDIQKVSKTQSIDLRKLGKMIAGLKITFGEHLENIEVYSRKTNGKVKYSK